MDTVTYIRGIHIYFVDNTFFQTDLLMKKYILYDYVIIDFQLSKI